MNLPIIKGIVMHCKLILGKVLLISIVSMTMLSCLGGTNGQEYIGYTKNELWVLLREKAKSNSIDMNALYLLKNTGKTKSMAYYMPSKDGSSMPEEFLLAQKWTWRIGRDKYSIIFDKRNIVIRAKMNTLRK